ncbi:hypothetical protein MSG28_015524 [Choristoneura fumiferana]|uniref:Uncharacterized protein n=1 Tax=Choristoneura fumiferana TaxID=7141 RepID=A0ACC0KAH8_CHOFU|nr:hypothetical protein MSG28_015524 [Choristoneura fumiferana]
MVLTVRDTCPQYGAGQYHRAERAAQGTLYGAHCAGHLPAVRRRSVYPGAERAAQGTLYGAHCAGHLPAVRRRSVPPALSALLREHYMVLTVRDTCPQYGAGSVTSLKEAWKWTFGVELAGRLGLRLASGARAALLVTLHYEHPGEGEDLELLKGLSPSARGRRPALDVTRRGAEAALAQASCSS